MSYHFLLDIALILISTKLLGLFTRKLHMPQVVGALVAGVILGPAVLGLVEETEIIKQTAELGVIALMFTAGLETNVGELKKAGKASFVIALMGVILPFVGGFLIATIFPLNHQFAGGTNVFLQNAFIGVVLTATSVSISVETLKELGYLNSPAGNAILGAALIDDILGIIALSVISSFTDENISVFVVLLKILSFFVFIAVAGYLTYKLFALWFNKHDRDLRRFVIVAFSFCLVFAYLSEQLFGVADITGAYFAGLIICNTQRAQYITSRFETLSYMLLSPMFFASIGIEVEIPHMTVGVVLFSLALLVVAILTKIIGCGFGARICGYSKQESLQIGVGTISRGEVALIVASKGSAIGLMSNLYFGPTIVVVIITTIITPILLKLVFTKGKVGMKENLIEDTLSKRRNFSKRIPFASSAFLASSKGSSSETKSESWGQTP